MRPPYGRFFSESLWPTLTSGAGEDAGAPNRCEGERHDPDTDNPAGHGGPITHHQREDMRNKTRANRKPRSSGSNRKSGTASRKTSRGISPQYTAQERERMQTGLRILARIIARAHLRTQASGGAGAPPDREAGD